MASALRAVVLAAGKGTRMNSARPKVLHEAAGRPILHYVLDLCEELGAETVVVVGHQAAAVREACSSWPRLGFATQEPQLGTGHAVQVALGALPADGALPVLVLAGDVPLLRAGTLRALCALREDTGAAAALVSFRTSTPGAYGRVLRDGAGRVSGIIEAKDASAEQLRVDEVNASLYVFDGEKLGATIRHLRPNNAQGEFYLTDVIGLMVAKGERVEALLMSDPTEATGVNTAGELSGVEGELYARRTMALVGAGVSIERPDTVLVGPAVRVASGARIRAFTILEGVTRVEAGASVGPFCRIEDSEIGANATILDSCLVRSSRIEAGASVGPFAHIRPDSVVGENAKVGNFVELKKTHLGAGSKAPHLSYLGDATIGTKANIGAGTITCNYDGVVKSPTAIEDGAFVGSNSILVAPVRIGRGAYIAAGSVITKDVPAEALGLGRARQENKPGWASRRPKKH
ncbi:MAG TPA: bifunctional UDP-N-acetylglucosamine diphosphorylase/glucosamine-1-phosphate N-acetyltransferase GlmU [Vicinamibacteria bacterium]|nr:bifunctional UDP-N-acetylglucosamine diphosphorylase/glucosamine-1-phosphate N-acetyltransferase GlmU [Vicinamibacteria bacterium]